ncbi:hypothetical protein [Mycetocola reblochoni]|uniref:hypothetical protein n=1 Tax=Mycetocola reblochoni TaxID=331618 RepID=UPI003F97CAAB
MNDRPGIQFGDGSGNEKYRTCAECGADCKPDPFDAGEGGGIRIAFVCPNCGLHSVVDPFEDSR